MKLLNYMDTIDNYVKQNIEANIEKVLNRTNGYLTKLDEKNSSFSINELHKHFNDLLYFNEYLEDIDVEYVRQFKNTINRFPRYFQKYCNLYSNYITTIIKDIEKKNRPLEELTKEELIDLIRSKQ